MIFEAVWRKLCVGMMRTFLVLFTCAAASGCAFFDRVHVESVAQSAEKPSNVAVYLSVTKHGEPVSTLVREDFRVQEDDTPLDPESIGLTLLDRRSVAAHHTLVLVDVSGALSETEVSHLSKDLKAFVAKVRQTQPISVFAFDGSEELYDLGEYTQLATMESEPSDEGLERLAKLESKDSSRNLHGAIRAGVERLDALLMRDKRAIRVGTLIVVTRGPDLAGRVTEAQLSEILDDTDQHLIAVTVGSWTEEQGLGELGRGRLYSATSLTTLGPTLLETADAVNDIYDQYYLVSYCSPARAGERHLTIEVTVQGDEDEQVGRFDTQFNADGFGPGCDAKELPRLLGLARSDDAEEKPAAQRAPAAQRSAGPAPAPAAPAADDDAVVAPPPDRPGYAH